jgi:hypothetical protein
MKSKLSFVVSFIFVLFFHYDVGMAAQDACDPGVADTVYFVAHSSHSANGETLYIPCNVSSADVIIDLEVWNDSGVQGIAVPLTDQCADGVINAHLDSAKNTSCFAGSRVEDFDILSLNLNGDPLKTSTPPNFLVGAIEFTEVMPPGRGYCARLTFTVSDTGRICLDTLGVFYPPPSGISLSLVTTHATDYIPIFLPKTFVVARAHSALPLVSVPAEDSVTAGDTLVFTFSSIDPDSDILRDNAFVFVRPDCGAITAQRDSGSGTYHGVWEVSFKSEGCTPGNYYIIMDVVDSCGNTGRDSSEVLVRSSSGVFDDPEETSYDLSLSQNYPNPFNLSTEISLDLPKDGEVSLKIYNLVGQVVRTLVNQKMNQGHYIFFWGGTDQNGREVASGIYFVQMVSKNLVTTRKMVLLK